MAVKRFRLSHVASAIPPGCDALVACRKARLGELHHRRRQPCRQPFGWLDALNFLPRSERIAQQHGFRPFAGVAALFHPTELGYVT
jgi:hypothetical protein